MPKETIAQLIARTVERYEKEKRKRQLIQQKNKSA